MLLIRLALPMSLMGRIILTNQITLMTPIHQATLPILVIQAIRRILAMQMARRAPKSQATPTVRVSLVVRELRMVGRIQVPIR